MSDHEWCSASLVFLAPENTSQIFVLKSVRWLHQHHRQSAHAMPCHPSIQVMEHSQNATPYAVCAVVPWSRTGGKFWERSRCLSSCEEWSSLQVSAPQSDWAIYFLNHFLWHQPRVRHHRESKVRQFEWDNLNWKAQMMIATHALKQIWKVRQSEWRVQSAKSLNERKQRSPVMWCNAQSHDVRGRRFSSTAPCTWLHQSMLMCRVQQPIYI